MKLLSVSFILFALSASCGALFIKDLPLKIIEDIFTILVSGTVKVVGNCTVDPLAPEVTYWLSTKTAPDYVQIHSVDKIDPKKPVIFLLHGWKGSSNVSYMAIIRDAYHIRYDANVLAVDYGKYVDGDYFSSFCILPSVAENFARFLCDLNEMVSIENFHIVGTSMGAQLAGLTGQLTQKMCGTIGRITGLDPAGPLYKGIDKDSRLDKTDALFVDVIHTNQGQFGYTNKVGHMDFYPNCGYFQPGCQRLSIGSIRDIMNLPLSIVLCNHGRSCYLFAESINKNNFYATSCVLCGLPACFREIIGIRKRAYMGESCRSPQRKEEYTLLTWYEPPYGLGPEGPLN